MIPNKSRIDLLKGKKIIGWKKACIFYRRCSEGEKRYKQFVLIKLEIPADADRVQPCDRKCRAAKAKVLSIVTLRTEYWMEKQYSGGKQISVAYSDWDSDFKYRKGRYVYPKEEFDNSLYNECCSGIHFFLTRKEALDYVL